MKKAGALLARRPYSRAELQKKLTAFADEAQVESVLQRLEVLKLLNDLDYAYNFALRHIRQNGWSPARVRHALLAHRVHPGTVERALQQACGETGGEESAIREYLRKRYAKTGLPADAKGVRKLIAHLRQRGFEAENIWSALKGKIPDAILQRFETGETLD